MAKPLATSKFLDHRLPQLVFWGAATILLICLTFLWANYGSQVFLERMLAGFASCMQL